MLLSLVFDKVDPGGNPSILTDVLVLEFVLVDEAAFVVSFEIYFDQPKYRLAVFLSALSLRLEKVDVRSVLQDVNVFLIPIRILDVPFEELALGVIGNVSKEDLTIFGYSIIAIMLQKLSLFRFPFLEEIIFPQTRLHFRLDNHDSLAEHLRVVLILVLVARNHVDFVAIEHDVIVEAIGLSWEVGGGLLEAVLEKHC